MTVHLLHVREVKSNLRHFKISGFGIDVLEAYLALKHSPFGRIHIAINGKYVKDGLRFDLDKQIVFEDDIKNVLEGTDLKLKEHRATFLRVVLPTLLPLIWQTRKRQRTAK